MPSGVRTRTSGITFEVAPPPVSLIDPATTAWVNAVVAHGGTVSAPRQTLINSLIVGLKADAVWSKLDRLYIHAAENQTSGLIDLVADALATAVNSPTFTVDRGFTGNATSMYIDPTYNLATAGGQLTLNSAHLGGWAVTVDAVAFHNLMGASDGSNETTISWNTNWIALVNDGAAIGSATFGGGAGHIVAVRSASNVKAIYGNGGSKDSNVQVSTGLTNAAFTILAESATGPSANQIAASHWGGSLTDTDVSNLYSRLRTYMTAVGVP